MVLKIIIYRSIVNKPHGNLKNRSREWANKTVNTYPYRKEIRDNLNKISAVLAFISLEVTKHISNKGK